MGAESKRGDFSTNSPNKVFLTQGKALNTNKARRSIRNHLMSLAVMAMSKGYALRFPDRDPETNIRLGNHAFAADVGWHCSELDELGVPFLVQNKALHMINEIGSQKVWNHAFTTSLDKIVDSWMLA